MVNACSAGAAPDRRPFFDDNNPCSPLGSVYGGMAAGNATT
jgi:hypothetical protein